MLRMHDDSFLPWALYGKSACILVPLPQRFREHGWLLPQLFPRSALAWRTRSASIDTNEASKELLFFSQHHRKKSCSKEELSILRTWLKGVVLPATTSPLEDPVSVEGSPAVSAIERLLDEVY